MKPLNISLAMAALCVATASALEVDAPVTTHADAPVTTQAQELADEGRIWIRILDTDSTQRALLNVRFQDQQPADGTIVFDCEIHSDAENGRIVVSLHVQNEDGNPIHYGEVRFWANEGLSECQFRWDNPPLADGIYTAYVDVTRPASGLVLASTKLQLLRLTRSPILDDLKAAQAELEALKTHLAAAGEDLSNHPYLSARWAIAQDALAAVSQNDQDWRKLSHAARYARRTASSIRTRLSFSEPLIAQPSPAADPRVGKLHIHDGGLKSGDRPVFLVGVHGLPPSEKAAQRLSRYGLNWAAVTAKPTTDSDTVMRFLKETEKLGISVTYLHDGHPRSLHDQLDEPGDKRLTTDYGVADALSDTSASLHESLKLFADSPQLNGISVVSAPKLMFTGEAVRTGFVSWLKQRYADRNDLNRRWRTRFFDFDEVEIWGDEDRSPYQFDWQTYHRTLGQEFTQEIIANVSATAPGTQVFATLSGDYFEAGETRYGIDREALSTLMPIQAFTYSRGRSHPILARAYPAGSAEVILRRSLNPKAPVFEFLDVPMRPDEFLEDDLFGYVYSTVWDAAIDGVNAFAIPAWTDHADPNTAPALIDLPDALEGLSTASLDLNRLAPIVSAFQNAPANLGILLSDASKIFQGGAAHLRSVLEALEGASFSGLKIRFLTETQLQQGALKGIEAIVLPNTPALRDETFAALQKLSQTRMVILRTGQAIPYDAWGRSRIDLISFSIDSLLVRDHEVSTEYMHAIEAAIVSRLLPEVPRAINNFGYTLEGVKTRSVKIDGATYVYLLNLRPTSVPVALAGQFRSGFDLVTGTEIRFPTLLHPLQPLLIRMDPPPTTTDVAMEVIEPPEDESPRTAAIKPISAFSDEDKALDHPRHGFFKKLLAKGRRILR